MPEPREQRVGAVCGPLLPLRQHAAIRRRQLGRYDQSRTQEELGRNLKLKLDCRKFYDRLEIYITVSVHQV